MSTIPAQTTFFGKTATFNGGCLSFDEELSKWEAEIIIKTVIDNPKVRAVSSAGRYVLAKVNSELPPRLSTLTQTDPRCRPVMPTSAKQQTPGPSWLPPKT